MPPVVELSIVLPCLNEERTVRKCVTNALGFLKRNGIRGEVVVADNASTDRSPQIASEAGARVVSVERRGYGHAIKGGIQAARGKFIIVADADESYDLKHLLPFVTQMRLGCDLVMGNRFSGGIHPGAMPWLHQYVGNPVLSWIGRLFFHTPVRDFHCGLRGFSKAAAQKMDLRSGGMELASEIVIKASLLGMRVSEVPTTLAPDGRGRKPHLRTFRDGWRHLRFLLLYSPRWLFAYPGIALLVLGSLLSAILFLGPVRAGARLFDFHSLFLAGSIIMMGTSMLAFSVITRVFAYNTGLLPARPPFFSLLRYINLEKGLLAGGLLFILGLALVAYAAVLSGSPGFSTLGFDRSVRLVYGGSLALTVGTQTILTSFVLSVLGIDARD